jgi:SPP1 family predicted phage head-tail adaptor
MQPGKLRHRGDIQLRPTTQDEYGEPTPEYANVFTNVPIAIEMLTGREFYAAQMINAEINAKITMRWRDGITAAHRIVHRTAAQAAVSPQEGTIYDIVAPIPDNASGRMWLSLFVINRSNEGFRSGT